MNTAKTYKTSLIVVCGLALAALPAAFANDADEKFKSMDTDGDGRVSRSEHTAGAQQMFDKMDTNNDGIVTTAEMEAGHEVKKTSRLRFWDKKDDKSASEKISVIDQNNDGQLTAAEHDAGSATMFSKMDTDNDGYISKDECEAGHKMMKQDK